VELDRAPSKRGRNDVPVSALFWLPTGSFRDHGRLEEQGGFDDAPLKPTFGSADDAQFREGAWRRVPQHHGVHLLKNITARPNEILYPKQRI
jgi:hypothetical protein